MAYGNIKENLWHHIYVIKVWCGQLNTHWNCNILLIEFYYNINIFCHKICIFKCSYIFWNVKKIWLKNNFFLNLGHIVELLNISNLFKYKMFPLFALSCSCLMPACIHKKINSFFMFNWLEFYEGWPFNKANSNKINRTLANLYFAEECNECEVEN